MVNSEKVFVLDTVVFLEASAIPKEGRLYTTSAVDGEVKNADSKAIFENVLLTRSLQIIEPGALAWVKVAALRAKIGDKRLSKTDEGLLALALDLKAQGFTPIVVTDDYSLQNACKAAGIAYEGVLQKGIQRQRRFAKKTRKKTKS